MALNTVFLRSRLAAAGRTGRSVARRMLPSSVRAIGSNQPVIEQLLLSPQDLRTADPSFASEIYNGHFGLAGSVAMTGTESPFTVPPPSSAWEAELHGFGWLRHLNAAGDEISREHARVLVRDWLRLFGKPTEKTWRADLLGRRVISWLSHSRTFLTDAEQSFYEAVMQSLTRQVRHLRTNYQDAPAGHPRLIALTALMLSDLCTRQKFASQGNIARNFSEELNRQILADGGHVSRNPALLVEILLDFLPMRQCFIARDLAPPESLIHAIDRMMPMVRFFRLGDGSPAHFNGCGATPPDRLAAVLAHDDVLGAPVTLADQTGYCRLEANDRILVIDCGRPPPLAYSGKAHAGCLGFEMSSGPYPVIVNCGAPALKDADWKQAARTSAAHSTLIVSDTSSSQMSSGGTGEDGEDVVLLKGPANVTASVETRDGGRELRAYHDGYDQRFGITHTRRLHLSDTGETILGQDILIAPHGLKGVAKDNGGQFAIRFHLHPTIGVELTKNSRTALLTLPNNEQWQITSHDQPLRIEESVFLADIRGPRRTQQVVLHGTIGTVSERKISWVLEKSAARDAETPDADDDDILLLTDEIPKEKPKTESKNKDPVK